MSECTSRNAWISLQPLMYTFQKALSDPSLKSLFSHQLSSPMPSSQVQSFSVFVATWNVGGKSPHSGLNLDDFLQVHDESDIYVLGFQEIVPLNAGNVLVAEDSEPAAKWLALINQSLNRSYSMASRRSKSPLCSSLLFQKPSLKKVCKSFRTESRRRLKTCNCSPLLERNYSRDCCVWPPLTIMTEDYCSSEEDEDGLSNHVSSEISTPASANQMKYSLITGKQMVGIFVTVWVRKELVQHVSHLRISNVGRGILGCLGNKGCISVSMSFHQTSFCFVCSHLASGEKEGDQRRRNLDVIEIIKNTQFSRICKSPCSRIPEKIMEHDRVIWLGDLNYRIALSYSETRRLLEQYNLDTLLDKDQLKIQREAGQVFRGWKEGEISFAPTYKYSYNSDIYAGETIETQKKRRTPAWCDRILWYGDGIRQLSYVRGESRFSDHRPVCAKFMVGVQVTNNDGLRKALSGFKMRVASEEYIIRRISLKSCWLKSCWRISLKSCWRISLKSCWQIFCCLILSYLLISCLAVNM